MAKEFRGSYTVTVTPFTQDSSAIDVGALKDFLDWQLDVGVPGVIALGSTGEFLTVNDEERRLLVDTYVNHIDGRIPVIIGTMNAHTPNAVRYSREAESQGADGVMIIPPYYYTPTEDEIFNYYAAIDEAISIPVMLYNNPVTSNVDMSAALVARLCNNLESIQYIKESSLHLSRVREVIEATDGRMKVYAGEWVVDSYLLGAIGYVNPYGNYLPLASGRIFELLEAGRIDDARSIWRLIDQIDHIIAAGHPTYGHQCYSKALAALVGHPMGDVRAPLTTFPELGEEGQRRVSEMKVLIDQLDAVCSSLGLG
ncbi:MAG: dihydrodipicolinate synthase family protein [bacterium]|nr:dihydrodipicolinate synthase family protein [bacterium]MDE0290330.1 dihydrodipicolinate synthase family protein [bacterium]MDE0440259.1 dihydrodipicolinate synthase family protein [bacterium]